MGKASLVTRLNKKSVNILMIVLIAVGVSLRLVITILFNPVSWIFLVMWLALICLFYFHKYFEQYERYRLWGDAIFYLPIFGLI